MFMVYYNYLSFVLDFIIPMSVLFISVHSILEQCLAHIRYLVNITCMRYVEIAIYKYLKISR